MISLTRMAKFQKNQILKLSLIAALLIVTPLLSASLRSTYLYFIVNILILLVGAEAGLFSFFLDSPEDKKPATITDFSSEDSSGKTAADQRGGNRTDKVLETGKVRKSPSMPSIFFIGGGEGDDDDVGSEEAGEVISSQELFQKAETFIGNFYKELKIQREESWKKLHGLYQKHFSWHARFILFKVNCV